MRPSFFVLQSLSLPLAFSAGALLLAACAGKVVPEGNPQLQAVSLSEISGQVVACQPGYAHPNVCCEAAAGHASACGEYPGAPFQACSGTATLYPDPRSCCPLDGSSDCIAPPPVPPVPPPVCGYSCPPGMYQPAGEPGACCVDDAAGGPTLCIATASAGGSGVGGGAGSGCGSVCACPACVDGEACPPCDCGPTPACPPPPPPTPICACPACIEGEACPPCDCPPPPPPVPPTCGVCPAGWQAPAGAPYLCCAEEAGGTIACFSQGVPPPAPAPLPPGPAPVPMPLHGSASAK